MQASSAPQTTAPTPRPMPERSAAACAVIVRLRHRRDFLQAARALRQPATGFLLQARARSADEAPGLIRVGFTCSRKLGNAVTRNRAKRRLRAVARAVMACCARPGWDYVLVGRPEKTVSRPFNLLEQDLRRALQAVHTPRPERRT